LLIHIVSHRFIMQKHLIRDEKKALEYIVDCTLATVSHMAMLKSRKKGEYERQIQIAQTGVNWLADFDVKIEVNSRAYQVLSCPSKTVKEWVEKYES